MVTVTVIGGVHAHKECDGPCDKGGYGYPSGRSATVREIGVRTGRTTELCGPPRRSCRHKTLLRAVATFVRVQASAKLRVRPLSFGRLTTAKFSASDGRIIHTRVHIHARVYIALPFPFGSLRCLSEKIKSGREPDQPSFSYISRPAHATVTRVRCQRSPMATYDNRGYRRIIIVVLPLTDTHRPRYAVDGRHTRDRYCGIECS